MRAIYKYDIGFLTDQVIKLPKDYKIVRVEIINGIARLWAAVNTDKELVDCHLVAYKTGMEMDRDVSTLDYLGVLKIEVGMELALYLFRVKTELPNYETQF